MDKITRFLKVKITRLFTSTSDYIRFSWPQHEHLTRNLCLFLTGFLCGICTCTNGISQESQYNCTTPLGIGDITTLPISFQGTERLKHCSLLLLCLNYALTYTFKSVAVTLTWSHSWRGSER